MKEVRIEVYGRVQGVMFRDNVKKLSDSLKLKGFVMNKEDGSVSILAQGDKNSLSQLVLFVQKEPGFSKIESMSYIFSDAEKNKAVAISFFSNADSFQAPIEEGKKVGLLATFDLSRFRGRAELRLRVVDITP